MTRDLVGWNLTESERKLLNRDEKNQFRNWLKHKRTRQGQFDADHLRLDYLLDEDYQMIVDSDDGKGAAEIRSVCDETPHWRILWDQARKKLTKKQKRILDALLVDFRTTKAAEAAKVERTAVLRFKKTFFKTHFSQCFRAWKRDFE